MAQAAVGADSHLVLLQDYQRMCGNVALRVARTDCLSIEGVGFTLYYEPTLAPSRVCIRCDVLDLLDEGDARLMTAMLADNFQRYVQRKPVFALQPDGVRVSALLNLVVSDIPLGVFDQLMHAWVQDVKQWRARTLANTWPVGLKQGGKSAR